jgi:hypothetical protein
VDETGGLGFSRTGVVIANRPINMAQIDSLSRLPSTAAVLEAMHTEGSDVSSPGWSISAPDPRLPLSRKDFKSRSRPAFNGTYLRRAMWLNGWTVDATVIFGPRASTADKRAIWKTVASLSAPRLHAGQKLANRFIVGKITRAYPVRSVTPIGRAFLIHAPHGFYSVAMSPFSGYGCKRGPQVRRSPLSFSCPDGRRWDRMGRALWSHAKFESRLGLVPTTINHDGHVLVANGSHWSGFEDQLERQVWG